MTLFKAGDEVERREWRGWWQGLQPGAGLWPAMMAEDEPPTLCAICKRPILPGSGRYRTEEGDVHEECYQRRHGRKPPGGE